MTPDTELSLEDELRAAMASATADEGDNTPAADNGAGEAQAGSDEPSDSGSTRERDEHGRFKPKEAAEAPAAGEQAPADTAPAQEQTDKLQVDPYALAPEKWGADVKAQWNNLPPTVREQIVKREREVHQQFTRFDEERNFGRQVKGVVAPYEQYIKGMGAEPIQAFDYLLKTDYALRTAPPEQRRQMFLKAAADYGVDLSGAVSGEQFQPVSQVANDPAFNTLQQQIQRLQAELNNVTTRNREGEELQVNQTIAEFAASPDHPYFDRVADMMALLIDGGRASNLEQAYEMAVYANTETRALHLEAHKAAEDRKRQASAEIARAKHASGSVTGAPGTNALPAPTSSSSSSVEEDVREAIRAVSGRI